MAHDCLSPASSVLHLATLRLVLVEFVTRLTTAQTSRDIADVASSRLGRATWRGVSAVWPPAHARGHKGRFASLHSSLSSRVSLCIRSIASVCDRLITGEFRLLKVVFRVRVGGPHGAFVASVDLLCQLKSLPYLMPTARTALSFQAILLITHLRNLIVVVRREISPRWGGTAQGEVSKAARTPASDSPVGAWVTRRVGGSMRAIQRASSLPSARLHAPTTSTLVYSK